MLGCSPFIGAGQFGFKALMYYQRFSLNPENMVRLFLRSFEFGVKAVQLLGDRPIDALLRAVKISGVKPFVIYSTNSSGGRLRRVLKRLKPLRVKFVAVHAEVADRRDIDRVMERLKILLEYGVSGAIATHKPGLTIPWVERENLPVDVVLTPLNSVGYAMDPDFTSSIKAIKECSRRVVAIKPLAAGRLHPAEAFRFVYRYADSAAVGIVTEDEMKQTYEAALREYEKARHFRTK